MKRLYIVTKDVNGTRLYLGPDWHLGYPMWFEDEKQSYIFGSATHAENMMKDESPNETDWVVRPYCED